MYVSSYSTYISTTASQKNDRYKYGKSDFESKSFDIKSPVKTPLQISQIPTLPIDYISTPLLLKNRQEIESQKKQLQNASSKDEIKEGLNEVKKQSILLNFADAYKSNSEMFSLFQKPHVALEQKPTIDKYDNLRHLMVNTYISNDNYYKITA